MRNGKIACFALIAFTIFAGCKQPIRSGAVITRYGHAEYIPVEFGPGITPPTRSWDYTMTTSKGLTVNVSGAAMPGGRIDVRYVSDGADIVAANAGDYIYPADVRLDGASDTLLMKASGVTAALDQPQTWLFEYDLNHRRQIAGFQVDPSVLPPECQIK